MRKCILLDAAVPGICAEMGHAWDRGGVRSSTYSVHHRPVLQLLGSMAKHFTKVTLVVNSLTRYGGREDLDAWRAVAQVLT